jgi:hypothetical protein
MRARARGERGQPADILGQAAAAVADSRGKEGPPDPGIHAHRVGQRGHVRAGLHADVGHRVDERHLGGEERVRRALDELGRYRVGDDQRYPGLGHGAVDLADRGLGGHVRHADHDPVRAERVGHRVALAQELGVPRDLDGISRGGQVPQLADEPRGRSRRHGGLADDQGRPRQVGRERGDRTEYLRQVVAGAARQAGGAHAKEVDGAEGRRLDKARGEPEPAGPNMAGKHLVETGFEEPGAPGVEQRDLVRVDIDAEHLVPDLGHACGVRRAQMPAPDHRQPHPLDGKREGWPGGFRIMNVARRDVVKRRSKPGLRHGPVAEYRDKLLVELRERAPQRALKCLVRARAEVAGEGQCRPRAQIPEVLAAELEPQDDQGEAEHGGYVGVRNAERMLRHGDLLFWFANRDISLHRGTHDQLSRCTRLVTFVVSVR